MRKKLDGQSIKIVTDKERLAGLGGSHQDILCVCVCVPFMRPMSICIYLNQCVIIQSVELVVDRVQSQ